jgi:hypothetical protein
MKMTAKNMKREIRIRTVTPNAPEPNSGNGVRYYVTGESDHVITWTTARPIRASGRR